MSDEEPIVLLIEDELPMRRFLRTSLSSHGFRVHEAVSAREGLVAAQSCHPDVILLDLGLPDGDGIEVARQLREWSRVPIIVISARGREDDKVLALDSGADDYLTKPFGVNELFARIRVALRHARGQRTEPTLEVVDVYGLHLDFVKREVSVDGKNVHLTPTEYRLLKVLAENLGKVLTHKQLLKEVWGPGHNAQPHSLRVHMAELRKKIERNPAQPRFIINEPGVGYRMRADER